MINLKKSGRIESITYLRVLAVVMILYDHVGAMRNSEWSVKGIMDFLFCIPLKIIQEFGALGVSLFYLITGFLFFHTNPYKPLLRHLKFTSFHWFYKIHFLSSYQQIETIQQHFSLFLHADYHRTHP